MLSRAGGVVSAPLEQGETYQYRHTVTDANGVPTNAGAPPSVTITLPDGSTVTPTVVNSSAGLYDFDYLTTQVGRHTLLGSATGGTLGSAVEKFDDVFNVEQPGRMLVGFDEALTYLRGTLTITTRDDREQLRWLIQAASDIVERASNRILCRQSGLVDYFRGGSSKLTFSRPPLRWPDGFLTVTSIVENGASLVEGTDFVVLRGGSEWAIQRGLSTAPHNWFSGSDSIVVTYSAGCVKVPLVLRTLVLSQVQELWQESQQSSYSLLNENNIDQFTSQASAVATTTMQRDAYLTLKNLAGFA